MSRSLDVAGWLFVAVMAAAAVLVPYAVLGTPETSAAHMPRAAALFQAAGIRALPCPVDFTGDYNPDFRWNGLNWDSDSLGRSTWAVRERLGALWLRLRGKIE